ncbi:MAG: PaaI family thioesterase [Gemmatimonadetes bacterium]|nr:PaaI family thioesterase [Gemmatimonadota bacterium]
MKTVPRRPTIDGEASAIAGAGIAPLPPDATLERLRNLHHPRCFVGRDESDFGLGVRFDMRPDGGVEATVGCPPSWEGYPGMVHGGVIASLLDGAMTNALFARGTVAVTAEVKVRYWHPLPLGRSATVVGLVTQCEPPLYLVEARITCGDTVHATCTGKFMRLMEPERR